MRILPTAIDGVVIVEPVVHGDDRGHFLETFHARDFASAGLPVEFVQDNESLSTRHVLRGLHLQLRRPQGKLVRVVRGEIWDVADWDRSVVTNVPGQSGQPESPYYGNLLPLWDRGEYFPMAYSRARVDKEAAHKLTLKPAGQASTSSSAQR